MQIRNAVVHDPQEENQRSNILRILPYTRISLLVAVALFLLLVGMGIGIVVYYGVISKQEDVRSPIDKSQVGLERDEVSPSPISPTASWKNFTHPYHNYSIQYPDDWHVVQYKDGKPYEISSPTDLDLKRYVSFTPRVTPSSWKAQIQINVRVENAEHYKSITDYLNSVYSLDRLILPTGATFHRRKMPIAGYEWEEVSGLTGSSYQHRFVLVNGRVYSFEMSPYNNLALPEEKENAQVALNHFDAILSTFRVIEPR